MLSSLCKSSLFHCCPCSGALFVALMPLPWSLSEELFLPILGYIGFVITAGCDRFF